MNNTSQNRSWKGFEWVGLNCLYIEIKRNREDENYQNALRHRSFDMDRDALITLLHSISFLFLQGTVPFDFDVKVSLRKSLTEKMFFPSQSRYSISLSLVENSENLKWQTLYLNAPSQLLAVSFISKKLLAKLSSSTPTRKSNKPRKNFFQVAWNILNTWIFYFCL